MNTPDNLKYTKSDEWFDPESGAVGLTDYAQEQLSDIVFLEILVSIDDSIDQGDEIASVESVKAAAESYAPIGGTVVEINEDLVDTPELLNSEPYDAGWMIKIEGGDSADLMDAAAYEKYCEERNH